MKKISKIISIALTSFIVLMGIIVITSFMSAQNNYGVAMVFNRAYMVVKTDSMEPTLKVGTGIVVEKVDTDSLRGKDDNYEGDIITFYRPSQGIVVTHRIYSVNEDMNGNKYFECVGDNLYSSQCPSNDCTYMGRDYVYPKYVIGKVVKDSEGLGTAFSIFNNDIIKVCLFALPIGYLLVTSFIDSIKERGTANEKE